MPKTDERLPAHAIAEINAAKGKTRHELERFWAAWADVGDAKSCFRQAVLALVDAEYAFAGCRAELARLEQRPVGPRECLCGKHAAAIDRAYAEREAARSAVDDAIAAFKEP